jgi:hypothetical protein
MGRSDIDAECREPLDPRAARAYAPGMRTVIGRRLVEVDVG